MSELALQLIRQAKAEGWTTLDLGRTGLTELPEELFELKQLETLILSNHVWDADKREWKDSVNKGAFNKIQGVLPNGFSKLSNLQVLEIGGDYSLPYQISDIGVLEKLTNLTSLFIGVNKISDIDVLEKLPNLTFLDLNTNQIKDFSILEKLTNLTFLDLSANEQIKDFSTLEKLTNLNSLNLRSNYMNDINVLEKLTNLTFLDLSFNYMNDINVLEKLTNLNSLNLGSNEQIKDFSTLEKLTNLTFLDLKYNQISDITVLKKLTNLTYLDLILNQISDIGVLEKLTNLNSLSLGSNQISDIGVLKKLTNLNSLDLRFNEQIKDFSTLEKLTNLNSLYLGSNQISDIGVLEKLTNLNSLDLSSNRISDIGVLEKLTNLNFLDLRYNQIKNISPLRPLLERGVLFKWEHDGWNEGIYFKDNPLEIPPVEVVKEGNAAILNYFKELEESEKAKLGTYINNEIKLIIVGNSTAGKTTLASYLKDGKVVRKLPSTHWMEIYDWQPAFTLEKLKSEGNKQGECKVRIFDFGGQEYYHDTHHLFFSTSTAYLLLWDTDNNTLKIKPTDIITASGATTSVDLQHFPLKYWLEAIEYYTRPNKSKVKHILKQVYRLTVKKKELQEEFLKLPSKEQEPLERREAEESLAELIRSKNSLAPILIVQNKIDQKPGVVFLNEALFSQKYPQIFAYLAISLHETKRLNHLADFIKEMFEQMPLVGSKLPGQWGIVKESLALYKGKPIISLLEFADYCNQQLQKNNIKGISFDIENARELCKYLFNIGYLLFYDESNYPDWEELHDKVFIKQNWVIESFYNILKGLEKKGAQLNKKHVEKELSGNSGNKDAETIIALMIRFRLIFEHPHKKDTYIAPLYLPATPTKGVQLFLKGFDKPIYRIQYEGFIHKSVILHFFEVYGKEVFYEKNLSSDENIYYFWRYGLVVADKHDDKNKPTDLALIKFFMGEEDGNIPAHIDIFSLFKEKKSALIKDILETLQKINQHWKVEQMVSANGVDFVPLSLIHKNEEEKYFVFSYKGKRFELGDFAEYLTKNYPMKKLFISYSQKDTEYLRQLETHLSLLKRNRFIATWTDRQLIPGEVWDGKIKQELEEADIILFLVSADFLATDYIWDIEIKRAIEKHNSGTTKLVPIIVRDCDWEESPLGIFNSIGKAKPISKYADRDEAWKDIVNSLKAIIKS